MTILCATDFSQPAAGAMDVAVDLAKKRGEELLLWHAVQPELGDLGDPYIETDARRMRGTVGEGSRADPHSRPDSQERGRGRLARA